METSAKVREGEKGMRRAEGSSCERECGWKNQVLTGADAAAAVRETALAEGFGFVIVE